MKKILLPLAAIALSSVAFAPAAFAQDASSSSEQPGMNANTNNVSSEEFSAADLNKDDKLDFAEAGGLLAGLTQEQFDMLDGNDDGFLSFAEVATVDQNGSLLSDTTGKKSSSSQPNG